MYPSNIDEVLGTSEHTGSIEGRNAEGVDANIQCGSWVRFALRIDDGRIADIKYSTNGCGYMIDASEMLARRVKGSALSELHGLDPGSLFSDDLSEISTSERQGCSAAAVAALKAALAEYRENVIAASGDKALACTCFGVTVDMIEAIVSDGAITTDEVTTRCRAGGGCGSCRMLIQEIIDIELAEFTNG
jgi:NifU-like protein